MQSLYQDYVDALISEISNARPRGRISTIYIGGGTPTALSAEQLSSVLRAITGHFDAAPDAEVTFEANPGTVDLTKLQALRSAGFNRISLGIQSLDDDLLKRIGRIHSSEDAVEAYRAARRAGFDNAGLDLIHALPGQSVADWRKTLDRVVELHPEHASLYELSIEEGTVFARQCAQGKLDLPDEDEKLEMYEAAIEVLTRAGYEHYEISNFALPGFRSRHNQVYWRNDSYFGFGAGAVRYLDGKRCSLTTSVEDYIAHIKRGEDPAVSCEELTGRALMGETVMLALRTSDGVDTSLFESRFGVPFEEAYAKVLPALLDSGLAALEQGRLRLTHRGLLLGDEVSAEFLE